MDYADMAILELFRHWVSCFANCLDDFVILDNVSDFMENVWSDLLKD
jgi:hypothetical protein